MKYLVHKKWFYPVILILGFVLLIRLILPEGAVYGSTTDWFSQHAALAETIRDACLEQRTLLPMFLPLGGGSNGFQFAYYGYLRPDILIGCFLPQVSMTLILMIYMLLGYLISVFLMYQWLKEEVEQESFAFLGSVLFMTANCFFQTHRQVMFINYIPFLLLALLLIKKRNFKWIGLILAFGLVNSFFYIMPFFIVIGWYWYRQEGKAFLKPYFLSVIGGIGITAALLLPTFFVIIEHHRTSADVMAAGIWRPHLEYLLYSPYGMGLSVLCLYLLIWGLGERNYRTDAVFYLLMTCLGLSAYLMNGTLYARGKIMMPFVPLVILYCIRILKTYYYGERKWKLWPFLILLPMFIVARQRLNYKMTTGIFIDIVILFMVCLILRKWNNWKPGYGFLLLMPCLIYIQTARGEQFVTQSEMHAVEHQQAQLEVPVEDSNLYRSESLFHPLNTGNRLEPVTGKRSTMYSSITNPAYSFVYYDVLQTPIRINNRVALLTENNPFLFQFMGVRYIESEAGALPEGYEEIGRNGDLVIGENSSVLPIAYTVTDIMQEAEFRRLDEMGQLEAMMKTTIAEEGEENNERETNLATDIETEIKERIIQFASVELPEGVTVEAQADGGYLLTVTKKAGMTLELEEAIKDEILMLQFDVERRDSKAVVIDMNQIRNKLSGSSAPYPNGNTRFHYQFSCSEGNGLEQLQIELSQGTYLIQNVHWYTCPKNLLQAKEYQSVASQEPEGNEILTCSVDMEEDGYFVTSIPFQRGMRLWVDGEEVPLLKVNLAFAGAPLEQGIHNIQLKFVPPGYYLGIAISILTILIYGVVLVSPVRKNRKLFSC